MRSASLIIRLQSPIRLPLSGSGLPMPMQGVRIMSRSRSLIRLSVRLPITDAFEKYSWYFRSALVRANYNNLQQGIHATTKFLEMFFSNLLLETDYELKNRYLHIDYREDKCHFDTLECTLEELVILELIAQNLLIKQWELVELTGKSLSTIKRIMSLLQKKGYLRRMNGRRYGKWEVLCQ